MLALARRVLLEGFQFLSGEDSVVCDIYMPGHYVPFLAMCRRLELSADAERYP